MQGQKPNNFTNDTVELFTFVWKSI